MKKILILFSLMLLVIVASAQGSVTVMTPSKFKSSISKKDVQLVDVRTPQEYAEGHIAGATNIDFRNQELFDKGISSLNKSKPVAVYCRTGHRSGMAAQILSNKGYQVYDLQGGIVGWQSENQPVVK